MVFLNLFGQDSASLSFLIISHLNLWTTRVKGHAVCDSRRGRNLVKLDGVPMEAVRTSGVLNWKKPNLDLVSLDRNGS